MAIKKYTKKEIKAIRQRFAGNNKLKNAIFRRDENLCQICKKEVGIEIDHIKPVAKFPELATNPNNLRASCMPCNRRRRRKWLDISKM